jgi:flagellar hook-associated protein 1
LAQQVVTTSNGIQTLRSSVEDALSQSVTDANTLLQQLANLNTQISAAPGANNLDLLDSRDAALSQLSNLMTITVTQHPDGTVDLATRNGSSLLSGGSAATLRFNAHSNLSANSLYSTDPNQSGVGTITLTSGGRTTDLLASGAPIGGQIGGLVDLRDNVLVQAQSQLDDFAAGVSQALSNRQVSSSPVTAGLSIDTTGLQRGNRISLSYVDKNGVSHQATIIRVDDASQLPLPNTATGDPNDQVIGVSFANGVASAATAIQSALDSIGRGLTVSTSSATPPTNDLTVTAASPASVASLSASITNTQLQGQGAALPVFVDGATGSPYTASFDNGNQRVGYGQRIEVNPALQSLPSALTDATGNSSTGDLGRINALVSQLSSQPIDVSSQSSIPYSKTMTAGNFVKQILQTQANNTNQLTTLNNSQSVVLSSVQARFNQGASVNMDEELTNLTALQNVYAANAKVMTAVRDMFTVLMQM